MSLADGPPSIPELPRNTSFAMEVRGSFTCSLQNCKTPRVALRMGYIEIPPRCQIIYPPTIAILAAPVTASQFRRMNPLRECGAMTFRVTRRAAFIAT